MPRSFKALWPARELPVFLREWSLVQNRLMSEPARRTSRCAVKACYDQNGVLLGKLRHLRPEVTSGVPRKPPWTRFPDRAALSISKFARSACRTPVLVEGLVGGKPAEDNVVRMPTRIG